jgi:hypothetical protein
MPDNASLVKKKNAVGCFKKENLLVTKLIMQELKFAGQGFKQRAKRR